MLLIQLAFEGERDFVSDLQELRNILKTKSINIGMSESIEKNTHFIKIFCNDIEEEKNIENIESIKNKVFTYVANLIYKEVISEYRKRELLEYITENYFFLRHDEIIEIDSQINRILQGKEKINDGVGISLQNKINYLNDVIKEFLLEEGKINIDGFIRFRLKSMKSHIEFIVDKIVELYMVEKEYNEFIKLLKYFVEIQESKIDLINIIIKSNGEYIVEDKNGKNLFDEFIKDLIENKESKDANAEDIIISGLITNAPKHISIINKEYCLNKEFLNTISEVFGDRVLFKNSTKIL
ncbi:putative sporulation protein YtxC [Clostridium sp.]|uniref:putative sporulation protein YtxC n=1 Tax=Clostridium sp. TaxID=1506 RepID=UPI0039955517